MIRYDAPRNVLVVTKGHPFDQPAFFAMLDAIAAARGFAWTHVEHPAATALFRPEEAARFDAFLLYDLPGILFRVPEPPVLIDPPPGFLDHLEALLARGMPFLFLHHAIAGWAACERYAEIIGGRFLYQPAMLRGRPCPDSGYRHDVTHHVRPVADHPITTDLDTGFTITDELYLHEVFEDSVTPLLRSDYQFTRENFFSARRALEGAMHAREGWDHPPGSDLIAWTRREQASDIVTIQCGDGQPAYANPGLRTLIGNALAWLMRERTFSTVA